VEEEFACSIDEVRERSEKLGRPADLEKLITRMTKKSAEKMPTDAAPRCL